MSEFLTHAAIFLAGTLFGGWMGFILSIGHEDNAPSVAVFPPDQKITLHADPAWYGCKRCSLDFLSAQALSEHKLAIHKDDIVREAEGGL